MTALRAAVIGCGAVAGNHVAAYRATPGVELVAVCDVDVARARAFAQQHDIPNATSALAEVLDAGRVDVVSVATPHPTHAEIVTAAARAGVNVICEKPLAIELEVARRMVEACDEAGVLLATCYQRRFWPAAQRIRRAIDEGQLGTPVLGDCQVQLHRTTEYYSATPWRGSWSSDGGGVLMTQAIHYLDLLQWFLGDVREVHGHIATIKHGDQIEVEDTAVATLRFASGALATVRASTATEPALGARVSITGSTGRTVSVVEYPEGTPGINDLWLDGQTPEGAALELGRGPEVDLSAINGALVPYHTALVSDACAAIRERRAPLVTGRQALASLAIVLAIYESHRTGSPVSLELEEA